MTNPTPKPGPTPRSRMPHLLHVTTRGMHLHWARNASREDIERSGEAARAFAGPDLYRPVTDPVPVRQLPGWYPFGVDDDGNALVGSRLVAL